MRGLRGGNNVWQEWCHIVGADQVPCVSLFDYHGVIDTLDHSDAVDLGVHLDHLITYNGSPILSALCSYGKLHSLKTFDPRNPWSPAICELEGYVFTD